MDNQEQFLQMLADGLLTELGLMVGEGAQRPYMPTARPKQLAPDDPRHCEADANGYACGCEGVDNDWMIWMILSGRGWGKTAVGSNWLVHQAMSHPRSEWAVLAPTFRDTRKVCIEGSTGILTALRPGELVNYRRNELHIQLSNGSVIYGYSADNPERARGANLHGAWVDELGCLPGSVTVKTERGDIPISQVRRGDQVWTRHGLRPVRWSGPTRRNAELWEIRTASGHVVQCTPDHRVWTNLGWKQARYVTPDDILYAWTNSLSLLAPPRGSSGTANAGTESTSLAMLEATTVTPAGTCSTVWCGSVPTDRLGEMPSSTTLTTTRPTTNYRTCNCSPIRPNIATTIQKSGLTLAGRPTALAKRQLNVPTVCGQLGSPNRSLATGAEWFSTQLECAPNSAEGHVGLGSAVTASRKLPYREPVTYDLTVDGAPEFYANGLLVHNSWRYEQTWYEGLIPALRKGENPRVVVTTTPRPTSLIRDLVGRRDGSVHVTRGSTWENRDNLSKAALAELKRRYEGTRIGRQELEGELLDDIEGALWQRSDIDDSRITLAEVPSLIRVVVAVDPAVTSGEDADDTGIVVVGESAGHGYVLGDYSMHGTPLQCMKMAVKAYYDHSADAVVGEVNNGGDYIGALLRTVDRQIPYRQVRASRGKAIRAEPVASLYEQHRVHHVGSFPDLEDQLCTWVPDLGESPDRLDALVWAVSELRGLSAGGWSEAYGVERCESCDQPFLMSLHPFKCPHCRQDHGHADPAAA